MPSLCSLAPFLIMSDTDDTDDLEIDAIVKTAASLSPERLAKFLTLMQPPAQEIILSRLKNDGNRPGLSDAARAPKTFSDTPGRAPKTIVQKPGPRQKNQRKVEHQEVDPSMPATVIANPNKKGAGPKDKSPDDNPTKSKTTSQRTIENGNDQEDTVALSNSETGVHLVRLHAQGAIGEVFVAYDEQLSREIAIKRIRPELPQTTRRVRRFMREAELTAQLQHPGIVPIYNLNGSPSTPHYTMPLVSGSTYSKVIKKTHGQLHPRSSREEWMAAFRPLLKHFIAVCNAIDYAHSQNILHRDIKPANIIIGNRGQTFVLDWGCAKKIGESENVDEIEADEALAEQEEMAKILGIKTTSGELTVAGSVMGTLEFMSPEQAAGDSDRVGKHSDIFGLGATLFNVLTNQFLFDFQSTDSEDVDEALEIVKESKCQNIDECDPRVPLPLVAICNRAMEKRPKNRYSSARELAIDVDAFLAGEPVSAYQEPLFDRTTRYIKRHRTVFATLLGTFLVGFISLAFVALMINRQRENLAGKNNQLADLNSKLEKTNDQLADSVEKEKQLTSAVVLREQSGKQQLYETQMLLASEASSNPGGIGWMRQLVQRWSAPEFDSFRGWEWRHLDKLGHQEFWKVDLDATANHVIFTRDHSSARVFDSGNSLVITIDTDGKKILDRQKLPSNVTAVDFNRDQSLMAVGFRNGIVKVYKTQDPDAAPVVFEKLKSAVNDVRWNIGADLLATCDTSGEMVVWHWYDRKIKGTGKNVLNQQGKRLLNWSYDGKQVCWTTTTEIRALTVATEKKEVLTRDDWIVNPCWSHEGKLLAYIGPENTIVVTDPESKKTVRLKGHQLYVESLAWHPNQHFLLSASADGSVRIWNVDNEKQVRHLLGHSGHVYSAAWSPDGQKVVSGGLPEDPLHVWDVSSLGSEAFDRELQDHPAFAWHPDGSQLAVAEKFDILIQNDLGESRWIHSQEESPQEIFGLDIDPTGNRIACVSQSGRIWAIDAESGKTIRVYDEGSNPPMFPDITSKGVAWSSDGKYIAGIGGKGKVRVFDFESGDDVAKRLPNKGNGLVVAWGPASTDKASQLAFGGTGDHLFVFDMAEQKIVNKIKQYGWKTGIDWSPDGTKLAVADRRSISIYDTNLDSQSPIGKCEGPSAMVWDVSWSKSENRIAALTEDGKICIWNADTWAFSAKFDTHKRPPYTIHWSPDGKRLVSTARHGRIVFQETGD